jgi:xanthine dehydrogenase accessory factor
MREILDQVAAELGSGCPFALVTLVSERGSTPRAAGAQMLVRQDGSIAGTIGGGLLEATMMGQAREAIAQQSSRVTSMALSGRDISAEEMMCGGHADVLVAYVPPAAADLLTICHSLGDVIERRRKAWLFTFFLAATADGEPDERGPAPRGRPEAGPADPRVSWCLLVEGEESVGELPCAAQDLRKLVGKIGVHGAATLEDGRQVHLEAVEAPSVAVICGAGHVAHSLAPITESAGFATIVLDDRPEFANRERFPQASRVVVLPSFDDALAGLDLDESAYVVIVTRGHMHDFNMLVQALRTPARYVGLMSSRSKWKRIETALRELGFGDADLARIHSPVGLSIGAETPAELAISVVAEMIQVRAERS